MSDGMCFEDGTAGLRTVRGGPLPAGEALVYGPSRPVTAA
jgi:hypothetical protein